MQSIDRLREYVNDSRDMGFVAKGHIGEIITTIEREVGELERFKTLHREPFIEMEQFVERLRDAAEDREDVTLFGVDYTALPVDAEGVPIRVGETVTCVLPFGGESKPFVVDRMELGRDGDGDVWSVALDRSTDCWEQPLLLRHHHAPTVEDVLREMLDAWGELPSSATDEAIIAEYAAKLRLKED